MRERLKVFCSLAFLTLMTAAVARATVTSARCQIQAIDAYGQPAVGIGVTLQLQFSPTRENPTPPPGLSASGTTDVNGTVTLSVSSPYFRYSWAKCSTNSALGGYLPYLPFSHEISL